MPLGTKPAPPKEPPLALWDWLNLKLGTIWVGRGKSWDRVRALWSWFSPVGKASPGIEVKMCFWPFRETPGPLGVPTHWVRTVGRLSRVREHGCTGFPGPWVFQWTDRYLGLPLNVASVLSIMTPKCFVQIRPFVANSHPPGAARVLRACLS